MKKLIVRGGLVLLALVIVGVVILYFSINSIIKNQVEDQGTAATGVKTTLQSVNLNPFGGKLSLNNFFLANPEGFTDSKLFSLGEADVQVQLGSLLGGDEVVVPRVNIDGATVLLELNGLNLNAIKLLKQVQERGQADDAGTEGKPPKPDAEGDAKGFLIKEFNITNTKVVGRLKTPGGIEQDVDITLAPIKKTDVRGVEMADVIAFAIETIMLNASREVTAVVPDLAQLQGQLTDVADQAMDNVGGKLNQAMPGLGDAAKDLGGKEVDKALGDLFGKKKKKDAPKEEMPAE